MSEFEDFKIARTDGSVGVGQWRPIEGAAFYDTEYVEQTNTSIAFFCRELGREFRDLDEPKTLADTNLPVSQLLWMDVPVEPVLAAMKRALSKQGLKLAPQQPVRHYPIDPQKSSIHFYIHKIEIDFLEGNKADFHMKAVFKLHIGGRRALEMPITRKPFKALPNDAQPIPVHLEESILAEIHFSEKRRLDKPLKILVCLLGRMYSPI